MPVPMDGLTKLEFWQQQWAAFTSAFWIMLPLFLLIVWVVWWFRGWMSQERLAVLKEQIAAVKEQVTAVEQQLKLAAAASGASDRAKDELEKQFQAYKSEVVAKGREASPAKVESAIANVASSNTDVKDKFLAAIRDLDFALYGAHRKLNPEELKVLQDLGKPLGRGMIKPK